MFCSCERGRVGREERAAARWAGVGEGACMVIVVAIGLVGVLGAVTVGGGVLG